MKNIYGPVNSRRLGYSLGISVVPQKTCSFDCIYCELGANKKTYAKPDYYFDDKQIISELDSFFENFQGKIDYLSITGYGEPTINKNLPRIAKAIREKYPAYKTALLTNSSFLNEDYAIESFKYFDLILPSMDAASEEIFRIIDRPDPLFTAKNILDNLKILRNNYAGIIELEILFCDGINTSSDEITLLYEAAKSVNPDKIWVNTVVRGPAYREAKPVADALKNKLTIYFNSATKKDERNKNNFSSDDILTKLKNSPMDMETIEYYANLP
ncbi:MAG TPA: radical SAM protein, partial [Spirochaetota bacterium]|nr:radical SAM protein [Spirochaetota bacterium]